MRGRAPGVTASRPTASLPSSVKVPSSKVSVVPFQCAAPDADSCCRLLPGGNVMPAQVEKVAGVRHVGLHIAVELKPVGE